MEREISEIIRKKKSRRKGEVKKRPKRNSQRSAGRYDDMSSHAASSLLPDGEPRYFPAVPRFLRCDYVAQLSLARIAVRYGELLEDGLLLLSALSVLSFLSAV